KPFTSVAVMPCTPFSDNASRTSSSLKGLMMASIFFMTLPLRSRRKTQSFNTTRGHATANGLCTLRLRVSALESVGNGVTPVTAEGPACDTRPRGRLATLVFIAVYHACHPLHRGRVETIGNDVVNGSIPLHVTFQDGIQYLVR